MNGSQVMEILLDGAPPLSSQPSRFCEPPAGDDDAIRALHALRSPLIAPCTLGACYYHCCSCC